MTYQYHAIACHIKQVDNNVNRQGDITNNNVNNNDKNDKNDAYKVTRTTGTVTFTTGSDSVKVNLGQWHAFEYVGSHFARTDL